MAEMELPLELITEILTRLPVKTLTRFKCVSKYWNSLISSRSFITHHFKLNPDCNIIVTSRHSYKSIFSASICVNLNDNNTDLCFSELNHPFKLSHTHLDALVRIIDYCDGILLIYDADKDTMSLYNPINSTYRLLPPIQNRPLVECVECFGFVYDSLTDDYKVIRVFQNHGVSVLIYVYSMRENVWKFIRVKSVPLQQYFLHQDADGANGVLYFPSVPKVRKELKRLVMCFDLRTEAFSKLDYPELDCYDFDKVSLRLKELRGCLCLLVTYVCDDERLLYADVWEMREGGKEGSWVKLFRIQSEVVEKCGRLYRSLKIVASSKDKGKVLLELGYEWLGWYDLVTKRVEKVETHGSWDDYWTREVTCVESLVSVSNDEDQLQKKSDE